MNTSSATSTSKQLRNYRALHIDAHHHLWRYRAEEFGWLDDSMAELRRDFLISDIEQSMRSSGVEAAITVQARESLVETQWLLDRAEETESICGVVGWAPLCAKELPTLLDQFADRRKLVGLREIVQAEPDGYLDKRDFDRGIAELTRRNFAYDLLIRDRQIEEAIRFVDRHPQQRFVLDHAAKPRIAEAQLEPWRSQICGLAKRENVFCKLSGLVTEADWSRWTLDTLRPYLDACVECFGPKRLMAGSDWPVCLVASTYANWWSVLFEYLASFSEPERDSILGGTAIDFYKPALLSRVTNEVSS